MKLIFGAKSTQSRSKRSSSGSCTNFVREPGGDSFILVGRPGLKQKETLGSGQIRGMIWGKDKLYVVSNRDFYEVNAAWSSSAKGTLGTVGGRVAMSFDGTYINAVDGSYIYTYNVDTGIFVKNNDSDVLPNPTHTAFSDGFHFINDSATGQIATHQNANRPDGNWDALDFSTAEYSPDRLISIVPDHGNLFLHGEVTTEVWEYDTNSQALPLKPIRSAYMEFGTVAAYSPIKYDNSVVWLSKDISGAGVAVRAKGWTPEIISTPELHAEWGLYSTLSDAFSQVWWVEGHPLWLLTFPSADRTWVYDSSSGEWVQFQRYDPDITKRGRHRANASALHNNAVVCGDYVNGNIYEVSFDNYDDDGTTILRTAESQKVWDGGKRLFHSRIELFFDRGIGLTDSANQGYDPKVRLEYSNDDGNTWHDRGWKSIGKKGDFRARVYWTRLGSARERIYRFSVSDPVKWIFTGAELDVA